MVILVASSASAGLRGTIAVLTGLLRAEVLIVEVLLPDSAASSGDDAGPPRSAAAAASWDQRRKEGRAKGEESM